MCIKAVEIDPWQLHYVADHFKSQEMCDHTVRDAVEDPFSLQYVPDWFVAQSEQIKTWHDYYYDDDEFIEWCEGYKKCKAQKAKLKEELMPIAWHLLPGTHQNGGIGACQETRKKRLKNCGDSYFKII